jgi:hypothetical protein
MFGKTTIIAKAANAESIVQEKTLLVFGANENNVKPAAGGTALILGIAEFTTARTGDQITILVEGIGEVVLGGPVGITDPITADADAKGVKAAATNYIIGYAMKAGVKDDIIPVMISRAKI